MTCGNSVCAADPDRPAAGFVAVTPDYDQPGGWLCTGCHRPKVAARRPACDHCWGVPPGCISPTHGGPDDTNACCICGDPKIQPIDLVGTDPHVRGGTAVPTSPPG